MTTTVTGAVAVRQKQDRIVDWVRAQQDEIAMVAATHVKPSAVVRVAHGALRRNPKLMAAAIANPQSLLHALLEAARLGHEPDTDDYYLVPFGNEVQGIEGYKGIIERMYRAGGVSSVVAQVVRQRDQYAPRGENTPPVHEYDDFASADERGPMRGAYAYAIFPSGRCSQVIRMGRAEIMEHKAKSRGSDKADSPWQQWEASMWKKTVLRGLEPYVPTSTEYRDAVTPRNPYIVPSVAADGYAAGYRAAEDTAQEIHDAEIVDDTPDVPPADAAAPPPHAGPAIPPAGRPAGGTPLPPLPGEEEPDPTNRARQEATASPGGEVAPAPDAGQPDDTGYDTPGTATTPQITAIWTVLSNVYKFTRDEKDQARAVCAHIVSHGLASTKDMSRNEAKGVLDTLANWREVAEQHETEPREFLVELLARTAQGGGDG